MTRVDFYVLGDRCRHDPEGLACRLAAKAVAAGERVYVHAAGPAQAERLDELMWTFQDTSFVPHATLDSARATDAPVLIGTAEPDPEGLSLMVNLASEVPLFFSRFERVMEVVPADDAGRRAGRARYRFYQDRGYPLSTHRLD